MKSFDLLPSPRETGSSFSVNTCISRSVFKTLSTDVQLDYAQFHGVLDTELHATDRLCDAIFRTTDWTPALDIEGHVRLTTTKGVIVATEVIDLVDWLVIHHSETDIPALPLTSPKEPQTELEGKASKFGETPSGDSLERISERILDSQKRLQQCLGASREAVRAVCADVFILQARLEEESARQTGIIASIQEIVGVERMKEIRDQLEAKEEGQITRTRKSLTSHSSPTAHTPYHIFTLPQANSGTSRMTSSPQALSRSLSGSKRSHEDSNEQDLEPSHRHKRHRFHQPTSLIPQTILNYSSDAETDDTYSDSEGTERDFEDDPYSFLDSRRLPPSHEIVSNESSEEDYPPDDANSCVNGTRWDCLPDFDDDSSDSDYQPPNWNMEDVWELEVICRSHLPSVFSFDYGDELHQCQGVLSDAGLTTDDPDEGYCPLGRLCLTNPSSLLDVSLFLEHLFNFPDRIHRENYSDDETFERDKEIAIEEQKMDAWQKIQCMVADGFYLVDFEQRLADLLESDQSYFYFDEEAWENFAPHPPSSLASERPIPKALTRSQKALFGLTRKDLFFN